MPRKKSNKKEDNSAAAEQKRYEDLLPPVRHQAGTKPILIVDGMNLAHAASYAHSRLSYKGKPTGILFGMPNMIRNLITLFKPQRVIICWDGKRSPIRQKLLPEYKSHRDKVRAKDPERHVRFLKQVDRVKKLFYYLGVAQIHNEDVEGDDMIYMTVQKQQLLGKVLLVSGDKDMLQMVNHDVSVVNPRDKYQLKRTPYAFSCNEPGVEIQQVVDFICLVGDSSDDIPGLSGIGPIRARAFLKRHGSIREYLKDKKAVYPLMENKKRLKKVWKRNRRLIDLALYHKKYNKDKQVTYYRGKVYPKYQEINYRRYCAKFNLKTLLFPSFIETFTSL